MKVVPAYDISNTLHIINQNIIITGYGNYPIIFITNLLTWNQWNILAQVPGCYSASTDKFKPDVQVITYSQVLRMQIAGANEQLSGRLSPVSSEFPRVMTTYLGKKKSMLTSHKHEQC